MLIALPIRQFRSMEWIANLRKEIGQGGHESRGEQGSDPVNLISQIDHCLPEAPKRCEAWQ